MASSASSSERNIVDNRVSRPPTEKPKLSAQDLEHEPIFSLYKDSSTSTIKIDASDANLDRLALLCRRFGWVPSVEMVEWLMNEANIMEEPCRLNFPVFPFMQEFKFTIWVAEVWADWSEFGKIRGNITTANKTLLLEQSMPLYADYSEESWEPNWRRLIKWEEPLEQLFQMRNIWYESRNRDAAVQLQDAILFNVAKVVLRFPGLMKEPSDEEDVEGRILFDPSRDSFSRRPFDDRESSSPHSPYSGAHAMLKSRSHP